MPDTQPPVTIRPDTSIAYGKYLAISVANCYGCHTDRDLKTGKYVGAPFAGGFKMAVKQGTFTTPNLTPDKKTGALSGWTAQSFIARFKTGAVFPNTPMPWKPYKSLSDNDLKAIFNYLKSLPPANNDVGQRYVRTE
jgi:mono/diheme cytochrome c family protein